MTAAELIQTRKKAWSERHDIDFDKRFRIAAAHQIFNDSELLNEIKANPEFLIEIVFVVVDKNQVTLPFFLNDVQQEFIQILNRTIKEYEKGQRTEISLIILKGRQQGFTTLVTAYQLAKSITHRNMQGFTLADKNDNSQSIFENKAKFPYAQLPDTLRPTEKFNNRRQFLFSKINSSWEVDTATKNVGRSRTINFFHGSECAFWADGISPIQAALGETFTKNCIKIYESTANGYNDFEKMWSSDVHVNCFFAWWKTKEYRLSFSSENDKQNFLKLISKRRTWIWDRLRWLRDEVKLDAEQLFWYYKKYEGYIDKRLIRQEYPCSPEEAFLLSGYNVFDTEKIIARLHNLEKPLKVGYFTYDYDGLRITRIRWVNDKNGYIKIYKVPDSPTITKYCIGGDTAGEGSDYFTGHVLDAKTGEQVAVLKHKFDEDQYTKQIYCLGKYYKNALIGIETNFSTYPVMELQRLGYTNQYVREDLDSYTARTVKRFGFRTTSITRPTIISRIVEIVRDETNKINDEDTLIELSKITKNEKGKIEAPAGANDDQMMGLAIAQQVRLQVSFESEVIHVNPEKQFSFEDYDSNLDYGETIEIT